MEKRSLETPSAISKDPVENSLPMRLCFGAGAGERKESASLRGSDKYRNLAIQKKNAVADENWLLKS